jgi:capsular exopolysaccharide synthesis family protein
VALAGLLAFAVLAVVARRIVRNGMFILLVLLPLLVTSTALRPDRYNYFAFHAILVVFFTLVVLLTRVRAPEVDFGIAFLVLVVANAAINMAVNPAARTYQPCNLGVTLAMGGRRVVIIDGDLRQPRVHQFMGLENRVGLSSVVAGKVPLVDALQRYTLPLLDWSSDAGVHTDNGEKPPRLYVLTAGPQPPNPGEIVASKRFETILAELKESVVDFVLIDTPAFMPVSDAAAIAPRVDGVFMLVSMDGTTRRPMLSAAKEFLDRLPTRKLGVIVVREKAARSDYQSYRSYDTDQAKAQVHSAKANRSGRRARRPVQT